MQRISFPHHLFAAIGICLLATLSLHAAETPQQQAATRSAVEPKVNELVKFVGDGRIDAMLERIGPVAANHDRQTFQETRDKLIAIYGSAGKYLGFDIVGFKLLTPRYVEVYALVYFERRPVLFQFGFYRVDDAWRPQTFHLETDFHQLLDDLPLQK